MTLGKKAFENIVVKGKICLVTSIFCPFPTLFSTLPKSYFSFYDLIYSMTLGKEAFENIVEKGKKC